MLKPLFVPLKKVYYNQFIHGIKGTEYRKYGPRWNEKVCYVGREVLLSIGYGKKDRARGIITAFRKVPVWKSKGGVDYAINYGPTSIGPVAEIDIKVFQRELTEEVPQEIIEGKYATSFNLNRCAT